MVMHDTTPPARFPCLQICPPSSVCNALQDKLLQDKLEDSSRTGIWHWAVVMVSLVQPTSAIHSRSDCRWEVMLLAQHARRCCPSTTVLGSQGCYQAQQL